MATFLAAAGESNIKETLLAGHKSGNKKCEDCMVHSGFEATAAADMMRPQNIIGSIRTVFAK